MAYSVSKAAGMLAYRENVRGELLSYLRTSLDEVSRANARPQGSS